VDDCHLESHDWALMPCEPDQLIFRGVQGRQLATITHRQVWDRARRVVFSEADYRSPLARRPNDLRHACLSTWLNGGVAPAQVAQWAGHSVEVLLRVYAKCLEGQDDIAKRKIIAALAVEDHDDSVGD
jgi:integrase